MQAYALKFKNIWKNCCTQTIRRYVKYGGCRCMKKSSLYVKSFKVLGSIYHKSNLTPNNEHFIVT